MQIREHLKILVKEIAVEGSRRAYRQIFDLLFVPLMNFAYPIVKCRETAEEIASDVLLMIWEQREQLTGVANIRYYAFVAAKNRALNARKKKGLNAVSIEEIDYDIKLDKSDPEAIFLHGELTAQLDDAIAKLPRQCKLVFKLVREEGFSYQETADMLSISVRTVNAHLVHATKRLAGVLKKDFRLS